MTYLEKVIRKLNKYFKDKKITSYFDDKLKKK